MGVEGVSKSPEARVGSLVRVGDLTAAIVGVAVGIGDANVVVPEVEGEPQAAKSRIARAKTKACRLASISPQSIYDFLLLPTSGLRCRQLKSFTTFCIVRGTQ